MSWSGIRPCGPSYECIAPPTLSPTVEGTAQGLVQTCSGDKVLTQTYVPCSYHTASKTMNLAPNTKHMVYGIRDGVYKFEVEMDSTNAATLEIVDISTIGAGNYFGNTVVPSNQALTVNYGEAQFVYGTTPWDTDNKRAVITSDYVPFGMLINVENGDVWSSVTVDYKYSDDQICDQDVYTCQCPSGTVEAESEIPCFDSLNVQMDGLTLQSGSDAFVFPIDQGAKQLAVTIEATNVANLATLKVTNGVSFSTSSGTDNFITIYVADVTAAGTNIVLDTTAQITQASIQISHTGNSECGTQCVDIQI
jgi:hypothetical protein